MKLTMEAPPWLETLARRFNRFETRQRVLAAVGVIVFVNVFMFIWFLDPLLQAQMRVEKQIQATQVALEEQKKENERLLAKLRDDPNEVVLNKIAHVQENLINTQGEMEALTIGLIAAEDMPGVLRQALAAIDAIRLLEFITLPPVKLLPVDSKANLYQHGIRLSLEGRFLDIFQFLVRLELLSENFYWRAFEYTVQEHPVAIVNIELYTLSINKAFLRG